MVLLSSCGSRSSSAIPLVLGEFSGQPHVMLGCYRIDSDRCVQVYTLTSISVISYLCYNCSKLSLTLFLLNNLFDSERMNPQWNSEHDFGTPTQEEKEEEVKGDDQEEEEK